MSIKDLLLTALITSGLGVGAGLAIPKIASGEIQLPQVQPAPIVQPAQVQPYQVQSPQVQQQPAQQAQPAVIWGSDESAPPIMAQQSEPPLLPNPATSGEGQTLAMPLPATIPQGPWPDDNPGYTAPSIPANEPPPATELLALPSDENPNGYAYPVCIASKTLAIFYAAGDANGANQTATGLVVYPGQALIVVAQPAGGWQPISLGGKLYFVWALDCPRQQP